MNHLRTKVLCCRNKCCPQLVMLEGGKAAITADSKEDDVAIHETSVVIRFTREQLQVLVDELAAAGVKASPNA